MLQYWWTFSGQFDFCIVEEDTSKTIKLRMTQPTSVEILGFIVGGKVPELNRPWAEINGSRPTWRSKGYTQSRSKAYFTEIIASYVIDIGAKVLALIHHKFQLIFFFSWCDDGICANNWRLGQTSYSLRRLSQKSEQNLPSSALCGAIWPVSFPFRNLTTDASS